MVAGKVSPALVAGVYTLVDWAAVTFSLVFNFCTADFIIGILAFWFLAAGICIVEFVKLPKDLFGFCKALIIDMLGTRPGAIFTRLRSACLAD